MCLTNFCKKKFKPENKLRIENLQEKLHKVESKPSKGTKIRANSRWEFKGEKCSKTFFKIIEEQNLRNKTISAVYTPVILATKIQNLPVTLRTFLNQLKTFLVKLNPREDTSKTIISYVLSKILKRKKLKATVRPL